MNHQPRRHCQAEETIRQFATFQTWNALKPLPSAHWCSQTSSIDFLECENPISFFLPFFSVCLRLGLARNNQSNVTPNVISFQLLSTFPGRYNSSSIETQWKNPSRVLKRMNCPPIAGNRGPIHHLRNSSIQSHPLNPNRISTLLPPIRSIERGPVINSITKMEIERKKKKPIDFSFIRHHNPQIKMQLDKSMAVNDFSNNIKQIELIYHDWVDSFCRVHYSTTSTSLSTLIASL